MIRSMCTSSERMRVSEMLGRKRNLSSGGSWIGSRGCARLFERLLGLSFALSANVASQAHFWRCSDSCIISIGICFTNSGPSSRLKRSWPGTPRRTSDLTQTRAGQLPGSLSLNLLPSGGLAKRSSGIDGRARPTFLRSLDGLRPPHSMVSVLPSRPAARNRFTFTSFTQHA
jgi:hypothetical protein